MTLRNSVLTGRINLKRNTPYLLDPTTPDSLLTPTRQPGRDVRLEVIVDGAVVSPISGSVVIFFGSSPEGSGLEYIVNDESTGENWSIKIENGQIRWALTTDQAMINPIVEDFSVPGTFWEIFISDGQLGVMESSVERDDEILLFDLVEGGNRVLIVDDGQLGFALAEDDFISEEFEFQENGSVAGTITFPGITGISVTGITGGMIAVRAVNNLGQPINQQILVGSDIPVRFFTQNGRVVMRKAAQEKIADFQFIARPELTVLENDLAFITRGNPGFTIGVVAFSEKFFDFAGTTHHTEAILFNP